MTVNPDDLLIFKMRGMTSAQRKQPEAKAQRAAEGPEGAAQKEVKQRKPLFAPKPKRERKPEIEKEARKPVYTQPEKEQPKLINPYSEEDETRLRELETLEQRVALYANPPAGLEAERHDAKSRGGEAEKNGFSTLTGVLLVSNAIIFGYFIYPQAIFLVGYAVQNGIATLLFQLSYEYGTSLVNLILTLMSALSGLLMIANVRRSHLLGGATGSIMLLAISFEYLTSNADYLLVVSVIAFVSIVSLAYGRMSAASIGESEAVIPEEVAWPRMETF